MNKKERSAAAAALGRRGGLIGGKARAEKLSPARRKAIGQLGAAKTNAAATARRLGREAGEKGSPVTSNPFAKKDPAQRDSWLAGWAVGAQGFLDRRAGD